MRQVQRLKQAHASPHMGEKQQSYCSQVSGMKNTHTLTARCSHMNKHLVVEAVDTLQVLGLTPRSLNASDRSEEPVHSFCLLGWESWLMTWQRSAMQIANICHSARSSPYIYLLILLNISAYYWLFVGGGQWCMFLHDAVQKKAISCNPHIYSCCFSKCIFCAGFAARWRSEGSKAPLLWK